MPRDGTKNLIPMNKLTEDKQKLIAQLGGKASGASRRRKKAMREQLEVMMSLKVKEESTINKLKKMGIKKSDMNNQTALLMAVFLKGLNGDVKAAEFIRDTLGENPNKIQVEFNSSGTTEAILLKLAERNNGFDEDEELNVRQDTDNSNG